MSTPIPYPPTTAKNQHECYYGIKENETVSLDQVEVRRHSTFYHSLTRNQHQTSLTRLFLSQLCRGGEQLCVRVVEEAANYEYRGCWDDDYDIEYARPGRGRYCAAAGGDIVTGTLRRLLQGVPALPPRPLPQRHHHLCVLRGQVRG